MVHRKYQFLAKAVKAAGTPLAVVALDLEQPAQRPQHPRKGPVINAAMGMGPTVSTVLADSPGQEPQRHPPGHRYQQDPAAAQSPAELPLPT